MFNFVKFTATDLNSWKMRERNKKQRSDHLGTRRGDASNARTRVILQRVNLTFLTSGPWLSLHATSTRAVFIKLCKSSKSQASAPNDTRRINRVCDSAHWQRHELRLPRLANVALFMWALDTVAHVLRGATSSASTQTRANPHGNFLKPQFFWRACLSGGMCSMLLPTWTLCSAE